MLGSTTTGHIDVLAPPWKATHMTSKPEPALPAVSTADRQRSLWTTIAIAAAITVWVGGILLPALGPVAVLAAILGVIAATIAVIRDQRTAWRISAGIAGILSLAGIGTYALILTALTV